MATTYPFVIAAERARAVERARGTRAYYVPPARRLAMLKPGDLVKVIAEFKVPPEVLRFQPDLPGGERFWVLLTKVTPDGLEGTVNNELLFSHFHGLRVNELVSVPVGAVHDLEILSSDPTECDHVGVSVGARCESCGGTVLSR
jgi:hypothetical protein